MKKTNNNTPNKHKNLFANPIYDVLELLNIFVLSLKDRRPYRYNLFDAYNVSANSLANLCT